jgi:hypothetical protein
MKVDEVIEKCIINKVKVDPVGSLVVKALYYRLEDRGFDTL